MAGARADPQRSHRTREPAVEPLLHPAIAADHWVISAPVTLELARIHRHRTFVRPMRVLARCPVLAVDVVERTMAEPWAVERQHLVRLAVAPQDELAHADRLDRLEAAVRHRNHGACNEAGMAGRRRSGRPRRTDRSHWTNWPGGPRWTRRTWARRTAR